MMPRWRWWFLGALFLAVVIAAIYLPILRRNIKQTAKLQQRSEEQARRELTQPTVINPADPKVKAKLFWASGADDGTVSAVIVELPLAKDPVLRSKQVLNTLLAGPVDTELRTLPPDGALLAFYLLPDGTAIADFSEALATSIPSGIESEQMAVDSITKTLEANVPQIRRLKLLIHGQEVETLAGHLDLSQAFVVSTNTGPAPRAEGANANTSSSIASTTKQALTRAAAAVKLAASPNKPAEKR
jgi:Sporulation and spore germination